MGSVMTAFQKLLWLSRLVVFPPEAAFLHVRKGCVTVLNISLIGSGSLYWMVSVDCLRLVVEGHISWDACGVWEVL